MKSTRTNTNQQRRVGIFNLLPLTDSTGFYSTSSFYFNNDKKNEDNFLFSWRPFLSVNVPKTWFILICFKIFLVTLLSWYVLVLILTFIIVRYIFQSDTSSHTLQFIKHIVEQKRDYRNESVINQYFIFKVTEKYECYLGIS